MEVKAEIKGPVLVTGGAGYIGGQTVLCLQDKGLEVVIVDDLSTGRMHSFHENTHFYKCRIQEQAKVEEVINRHQIRSVIHFAGSIKVDESIENPLMYYENNTEGSRRLISAAVNCGVEHFIFSSTAAVYGQVGGDKPVSEDVAVAPLNPYGWSKLFTERTLQDVCKAHGLRFGILRYFNVSGADPDYRHGQYLEKPVHLIGRAIDALDGRAGPLQIFGKDLPTPDGTGVRDYIHVYDLATAHLAVLATLQAGDESLLVNLGYGRGHSVLDVVSCLSEIAKAQVPYHFTDRRQGEAPSVVADVTRLQRQVKWQPKYDSLDEIVRSSYQWIQKLSNQS